MKEMVTAVQMHVIIYTELVLILCVAVMSAQVEQIIVLYVLPSVIAPN